MYVSNNVKQNLSCLASGVFQTYKSCNWFEGNNFNKLNRAVSYKCSRQRVINFAITESMEVLKTPETCTICEDYVLFILKCSIRYVR
jgi:hypothetical protein